MSENYIHIDNITEDRVARPGEIGIGAHVQTKLDGVSKFAIASVDDLDVVNYKFIVDCNGNDGSHLLIIGNLSYAFVCNFHQ